MKKLDARLYDVLCCGGGGKVGAGIGLNCGLGGLGGGIEGVEEETGWEEEEEEEEET